MRIAKIYDLTATIKTHMPIWPTSPLPVITPVGIAARDGYNVESYSSLTHTGTHIDAPMCVPVWVRELYLSLIHI